MELMKQLLEDVKNGKNSFEPLSSTLNDLKEFQLIAKRLISAHESGYIAELKCQKDYRVAGGLVNKILVLNALTIEGEHFLSSKSVAENQTRSEEDIIDLKPNFFGLGVNINALWRQLTNKN